jgi:hypothetical protein
MRRVLYALANWPRHRLRSYRSNEIFERGAGRKIAQFAELQR